MSEVIVKFIKWFISISAFIYGVSFLMMAEYMGEIKPVFLGIMCLGVVYWMSHSTYEAPRKILYYTVGILIVSGGAARYIDLSQYAPFDISYFFSWNIWAFLIAVPVMGWSLAQDD